MSKERYKVNAEILMSVAFQKLYIRTAITASNALSQ